MTTPFAHIAIVGAGALGGHVAAYLAASGHRVTVIDGWPDNVAAIRQDGLKLEGITETECFTARPAGALHICDVQSLASQPPIDLVFIAVKSYDTRWATSLIVDYLAPGAPVVSLQNSINEEAIADIVGWGATVGCVASRITVELIAPGHIVRRIAKGGLAHTVFRIGEPHGRITPRTRQIADLLAPCDSAEPTSNLWGERWTKLAVNCMRNPIAAATGQGGNANDRNQAIRRLSVRICGEALLVARAHGIPLEKAYGIAADDAICAYQGDGEAMSRCEDIIIAGIANRSDSARPSMGQDLAKGRRTEIDALNGYVARKAADIGVSAPLNAAIADIVRAVSRGDMEASPARLQALL